MADKVITSTGDCSACCEPPADCSCALLIPTFAAPYADYATAKAVITDPLLVTCEAYNGSETTVMTSFSSSFDGTTLSASVAWSAAQTGVGPFFFSVSCLSGKTISVAFTNADALDIYIRDCFGSVVESATGEATPFTSAALSADGVYYLEIYLNNPVSGSFSSTVISVTSSGVFVPNPVIALWDDSGTTRKLWACPKLLLPPLTESTGDWYASCADANTVLNDPLQVSNCVGYNAGFADSFSATDGGISLSFSITAALPPPAYGPLWGGVNCVKGSTITVAWTGEPNGSVSIYDDNGTLIEDTGGFVTSPWTTAALPYTGRYIVEVIALTGSGSTTASATITSSGTLSVNHIQARYDLGLTCAGTLDCGHSCP